MGFPFFMPDSLCLEKTALFCQGQGTPPSLYLVETYPPSEKALYSPSPEKTNAMSISTLDVKRHCTFLSPKKKNLLFFA